MNAASPDFTLRAETRDDGPAIREVLLAAFPTAAEADLVDRLRSYGDLALALVAECAERGVIAFAAFPRLAIEQSDLCIPAAGLAPLAVTPTWQRRGVGSELVRSGLARLAAQGEQIAFVLGDPAYYRRFGFAVEAAAGFSSRYAGPHFMACRLADGAPLRGALRYPPAFDVLG